MASKDKKYLTHEEELLLIKNYQQNECQASLQQLIDNHYDMICSMARKKNRYVSIDFNDLVQEGIIGIIKAIDKYDLDSGNRLNTYARFWIDNAMFEFIMNNILLIKYANTQHNNKVFFNIGRYRDSNGKLSESSINRMSEELSIPVKNIVDMHNHLASIYFDYTADDENEEYSLSDSYYEPSVFLARLESQINAENLLESALSKIDGRISDIIKERYLQDKPTTLAELASKYKISGERVRQLEADGIKKLKKEFLGKNYYS